MTGNLADDRVTVARLLRRLAPTYEHLGASLARHRVRSGGGGHYGVRAHPG
jgi:hypothetical protein